MFTLPKGIRTVCYIQFFALYASILLYIVMDRADDSLGWFPILFFTSIWVSEIYKTSYTGPEIDEAELNAQGVRAGARALLFQALVNITCSIGLPYLVTESGVQANTSGRYQSLQPGRGEEDGWKPMNMVNDIRSGGLPRKMLGAVLGLARGMKDGNVLTIPVKGLTLVRLWWISQFTFAAAMAMTWYVHLPRVFLLKDSSKKADGRFTTTVHGAYVIIGITGFSWGLAQCKFAFERRRQS
jgi:solute carrier family 45 protein 1/2/4